MTGDLIVINNHPLGTEIVKGAIPTPRLVEAGTGEAYFVPNEGPSKDRIPGVWYLRAPGYESPTGEYRRVRVVRS